MNKHIVLIFNVGHCGGRWFQDICNLHGDVQLWQEVNHYLNVDKKSVKEQFNTIYNFFIEQYNTNPKKVLGLIKAFDERLIKFCENNNGLIFQMLRNPIDVVDAKNGQKMQECLNRGTFNRLETEEEIFEAHTEFYSSIYKEYINRKDRWPIIKLEDLNYYLKNDTIKFRRILESILKVRVSENHIESIKNFSNIKGDLSRAYCENNKDILIYSSWPGWKKDIFQKYFKNIMLICNYKWE